MVINTTLTVRKMFDIHDETNITTKRVSTIGHKTFASVILTAWGMVSTCRKPCRHSSRLRESLQLSDDSRDEKRELLQSIDHVPGQQRREAIRVNSRSFHKPPVKLLWHRKSCMICLQMYFV